MSGSQPTIPVEEGRGRVSQAHCSIGVGLTWRMLLRARPAVPPAGAQVAPVTAPVNPVVRPELEVQSSPSRRMSSPPLPHRTSRRSAPPLSSACGVTVLQAVSVGQRKLEVYVREDGWRTRRWWTLRWRPAAMCNSRWEWQSTLAEKCWQPFSSSALSARGLEVGRWLPEGRR